MPGRDLGLLQTFAQVRQPERFHAASNVSRAAAAMRSGVGK
jgi:hypothetical protein